MEKYRYINEAKTKEEELQLSTLAFTYRELLSDIDKTQVDREFDEYRDSADAEGIPFRPWYRWMLDRVNVKVTLK